MSWDESDRILQMERTIARCEDAWLEPPDAYADEQEYSDEELMEVQLQVYLNKYAEATKAEAEAFDQQFPPKVKLTLPGQLV